MILCLRKNCINNIRGTMFGYQCKLENIQLEKTGKCCNYKKVIYK